MDLILTPRPVFSPRMSNWPSDVPCLFVPCDEGQGKRLTNHGTMGSLTLGVTNHKSQWREDGWLTTDGAVGIWPTDAPEDNALLDKLYFFRDCTVESPGVGGNILLVACSLSHSGVSLAQSRVLSCGVSGNHADSAAWQLNFYGADGGIRFFWRDAFTEVSSGTICIIPDDGQDHHVSLLLDALTAAVYAWVDGVAVTIDGGVSDGVVALFKRFTKAAQWDTNGITLTLGNTNMANFTPGDRTLDGSNKHLHGARFGDLFIADVTARSAVLAARRDDIAEALNLSPRGYLSGVVSALLSA